MGGKSFLCNIIENEYISQLIKSGVIWGKGKISVGETFRFSDLIIVLFVGITEEMVFRGWLLNATVNEKKKWVSVIVNSLMFLFIHFPNWIHEGHLVENFQNFWFSESC